MGKIREIWSAIGRYKYAITIIGFLLIICIFDQNNLLKRLGHQRQIRELKKEIEHYTQMRDQSVQGLLELANDSNNLEHIAREKYGMHLPNEEVFIIE
ncbi:MAG: septum formation initiator family protein [Bacteroidaceae bacterium]|jgi:cell division protein FtsB|nr:septum formation initiator family protein [Bacteroidaceae bacterium]